MQPMPNPWMVAPSKASMLLQVNAAVSRGAASPAASASGHSCSVPAFG